MYLTTELETDERIFAAREISILDKLKLSTLEVSEDLNNHIEAADEEE